jgi:hypothetical protein
LNMLEKWIWRRTMGFESCTACPAVADQSRFGTMHC